jgi:fibronectin-binding autotransporter adhesin
MKSKLHTIKSIAVLAATVSSLQLSSAQSIWNATNGVSANTNWSTAANWLPNGVPGATTIVRFVDNAAEVAAGTINNVVDATLTVASLQYSSTNGFHTSLINPGVTLSVTGANGVLVGTESSTNILITTTISGAGKLTVSNSAANFLVRQPAAASTANRTTLDLSGLDTFDISVARLMVGVGGGTLNRSTGRLLLARTNTIFALGGSTNAPAIDIGDTGGGGNNGTGSTLVLGQTNAIFADTITVGRFRETANNLRFNTLFTDSVAYIRGTNGANSRVSAFNLGDAATQTGTITCRGTADFSNGTVDALVDTMIVGQCSTGAADGSQSQGTLTLSAGTLDVNTLRVGSQRTNNAANVAAVVNVNGTATLTVNTVLEIPRTTGGTGAALTTGTLNINGGTVRANSIVSSAAGGNSPITVTTGTLVVTNTIGSVSVPISSLSLSDSTLGLSAFNATPGAVVTTLTTGGAGNTINILAVPTLASYPSQFAVIRYAGASLGVDFGLGTLPGTFQGFISNNVANLSIDLVITNGPATTKTITWNGTPNGDWNTSTTNWLSSGSLTNYNQNDLVIFDDTASGTTTVNLTTTLTPDALVVANSTLNYTFTGSGSISGAVGLVKNGSASLTLSETGGDNFSGGITVNNGTLILDNTNSTISGGLTINGGTVQIGNNNENGGVPSGAIADNGALVFNRNNTITVSTAVSGTGSLTQNGNGTLLLSTNNTYTGNTLVGKGTLALSGAGSISNGALVIVSNATLDVSGLVGKTAAFNSLGLTNSTTLLSVNTNSSLSIGTGSLAVGGATNIINILSLPPIASYPVTFTIIQSINPIAGTFNFGLSNLPSASPAYAASISQSGDQTAVLLTVTAGPIGVRPSVLWIGADVPNLDTNWSDRLNWQLPGAPGGADNVVFNSTAAQGSSALSTPGGGSGALLPGSYNNLVDANFTITSLTYTNLGGTYHNTEIASGRTLNVTNTFAVGAIDTGLTAQQEFVTVAGANAALNVNNTNANVLVWAGSGSVGGSQATLDLSALDNFSANVSRFLVGATVGNSVNRPSGIVYLARTNTITAGFQTTTSEAGTTTANAGIVVGDANSNAGSPSFTYLGQANTISADIIAIGRQKANGNLLFNPIYANTAPYPSVTFQGFNSGRVSIFDIGDGVGNTGTTTLTADANLTGGLVTAAVDTMNIGRASGGASGSGTSTGTLEFDAGTISVNTLNVGFQPVTGSKVGVGTVSVNTNATMGANARLMVSGNLNLGINVGGAGAPTTAGTLNINGGTVQANAILAGVNGATSTINLTDGTLVVTNTAGTPAAPLTALNLTGGKLQLNLNGSSGVAAVVATTVATSGTTTINLGSIANVTSGTTYPLISYTGTDPYSSLSLGTLPAGYAGNLVDDSANSLISLMITSAPARPPVINTIGVVGGQIVISGTNGVATTNYYVLTSTNIALPLASWTPLATNTFDGSGNFSFTNGAPVDPQRFYLLRIP